MKIHNKQVNAEHYDFACYMEKSRWMSLWHQMDEILKVQPETVLEVGKGAGVLGPLLKHYDIDYRSADIDPDLKPDHIASVTDLPFKDNTFDVVCCFQVLEHIPYKFFQQGITELLRVAKEKVIISLPDAKRIWQYSFHIPKKGNVRMDVQRPQLRPQKHVFDGEHYWEINKEGYLLKDIVNAMEACGTKVDTSYRVIDNPYHHFFVLVKVKKKLTGS